MSSNLMDTEKGGEQTQYEAEHTDVLPPSKSSGQLGSTSSSSTTTDPSSTTATAEQGEKTAEKIRYGQNISENGMGGFTTGQEASGAENGNGNGKEVVSREEEEGSEGVAARKAQGYGGEEDQNREIGG